MDSDYRGVGIFREDPQAVRDDSGDVKIAPGVTRYVYECPTCAALVNDIDRHNAWHALQTDQPWGHR